MGGIPVICGVHQCPPSECFDIHYPDAHAIRDLEEIMDRSVEAALEPLCKLFNTVLSPDIVEGMIRFTVTIVAPIIEEITARQITAIGRTYEIDT